MLNPPSLARSRGVLPASSAAQALPPCCSSRRISKVLPDEAALWSGVWPDLSTAASSAPWSNSNCATSARLCAIGLHSVAAA
jgi:hypothetical protein